jgi:Tannase and feruloyl esterase
MRGVAKKQIREGNAMHPLTPVVFSAASLAVAVISASAASAASSCEGLISLSLPHGQVTVAQTIVGATFNTPPGCTTGASGCTTNTGLPQFCRVAGTATPTSDSIINFEVWIPTDSTFNGKYEQLGCGGFCGSIGYSALANAIRRGYAAAATDDGSQAAGQPTFALGHPEKIIDYAYRALKETTDKSKAVIAALTGQSPQRSYFNGCSKGGHEALMEAQRYPDDFDGIIVGSPANFFTHLLTGFVWNEQALLNDPASYIPPSLLPVLSNAALAQCVGQDGGVKSDIFLNDPRDCRFDPATVQCVPGQDPTTCLSAAQVRAARQIYRGPHNPETGELIFPGYEPGSEANAANWPAWIVGASRDADLSNDRTQGQAAQEFFGNGFFGDFVFQSPNWDFRTLNFTSDVALVDEDFGFLNSTDPDLRPLRNHGAKIIHYVGWADSAIAPINSVNYYNSVRAELAGVESGRGKRHRWQEIQEFYRLFMVPGMAHCSGGDGPNAFGNGTNNGPVIDADHDLLKALDRWVEEGIAPERVIATHFVNNDPTAGVQFQRPLCPFPQVARHTVGDPTKAESFRCVMDEPDRDPRD